MKLYGKVIRDTKILKEVFVDKTDSDASYRDMLEDCLVNLCKELDIPVPIWLEKNTREFAAYRRTFFMKEQFIEKIRFDKFEIRVE